jgi:hypothetical protein
MNCKPGDLAVIVRCDEFPENIGRFLTVTEAGEIQDGEWVWACISNSPLYGQLRHWGCVFTYSAEVWAPDSWLRPIRDPGDDARDETLSWKAVPKPEREILRLLVRHMQEPKQ